MLITGLNFTGVTADLNTDLWCCSSVSVVHQSLGFTFGQSIEPETEDLGSSPKTQLPFQPFVCPCVHPSLGLRQPSVRPTLIHGLREKQAWIILDEPQIKSSLIQQVPVMFRKLLQPFGVYRTHNDCPINLPARRRRSRSLSSSWLPAWWQTSVVERWATVAHLTSLTSGSCTSHRRLWTSVNAASSSGSATPWTDSVRVHRV